MSFKILSSEFSAVNLQQTDLTFSPYLKPLQCTYLVKD